ncbi:MAG TPA: serine/threonine-protein kinase [Gammaproteobacteria bacterium]
MSSIALPVGSVLKDRYIIEGVLGAGGFGIVYRANDRIWQIPVAIKEFLPAQISVRLEDRSTVGPRSHDDAKAFEEGVEAFLEEGRRLYSLSHKNIAEVTDFVQANGTGYLVMKYQKGETLADLLSRCTTLTNEELTELLTQVLDGLEYVHSRSILHRDISPGNLFIRQDGIVLLIDFGASRHAVGERSRSLSAIVKPGYAPFEQYHAGGNQGPWTDLYALGATAYRCVTGTAPPAATERMEAVAESRPDPLSPLSGSHYEQQYSPAVLAFIDRTLALQASARPQSVLDARKILEAPPRQTGSPLARRAAAALASSTPQHDGSASVKPGSPPAAAGQEIRPTKYRWFVRVAAMLALLLVGGGGVYGYWKGRPVVQVTTVPPAAAVRVDGQYVGNAPLDLRVTSGVHLVEVSLPEYVSANKTVVAAWGNVEELRFELEQVSRPTPPPPPPGRAYLIVRSNVTNDLVSIDGVEVGPTGPQRHEVLPGSHTVRVTKPYYSDWGQAVTLDDGEERTLYATLRLLPNSCEYAYDGECDETTLCPAGTDTADCSAQREATPGADSCQWAFDGECDEPNLCAPGTDTTDCSMPRSGRDSCRWAFDGECDEPDLCDPGTDTTDCSMSPTAGDSCQWANDGECDEPGLCDPGTDTTDCSALLTAANSCQWAYDDECDEPNLCSAGTDSADCAAGIDFGNDSSRWARDGECDDPRFISVSGRGMASTLLEQDRGADASDCKGLFLQGLIRLR